MSNPYARIDHVGPSCRKENAAYQSAKILLRIPKENTVKIDLLLPVFDGQRAETEGYTEK